uniref:Uncharacterized protein n=1 Tax=Guillardia theta TaxID=55529 RepID=A0A6U6BWP0_GUITH|mmetsp:Transcript_41536/g.130903  ORF Transcript_41536/g.130903 Transcript_41536/m.130903 type:complete len:407 (+) Transcript_41536:52-1272(+)
MRETSEKNKSEFNDQANSSTPSLKERYLKKIGALKKEKTCASNQQRIETTNNKTVEHDDKRTCQAKASKTPKKKKGGAALQGKSKDETASRSQLYKKDTRSPKKHVGVESQKNPPAEQAPNKQISDQKKESNKRKLDSISDAGREKTVKAMLRKDKEFHIPRPTKKGKVTCQKKTEEDPAEPQAGNFPYEIDDADHAETPAEAYADISHVLEYVAGILKKDNNTVKIYDPYYCNGSVKKRLMRQGFPNVYNEREDFYKAIEDKRIPSHDILLTNPPYSGDHPERLMNFISRTKSPWFLLMPNWVYTKDYYKDLILNKACSSNPPFYYIPKKRYTYWTPPWLHSSQFGVSTSPFPSFWYIHCGKHTEKVKGWLESNASDSMMFAGGVQDLPNEVRAAFDPNKKVHER